MALKFTDGFDSYAATADLTKKWSIAQSPWVWHATNGRTGAGCVQAATTGGGLLRLTEVLNTPTNNGQLGMGFWFKASTTPAATGTIIQFIDLNNTLQWYIRVSTSGIIGMYNGSLSLTIGGSTNICDNAWHWIEIYTNVGSGSGTHKCHVDGTQQWNGSYSPSNTAILYWADFVSVTGITISLDDVIIYDSTGSNMLPASVYPLGPRQIATLRPTSDSSVQFTRSTGADSYALVDETVADTSDYVEDGTSGHLDLYGYSNIGFSPATVDAVMLNSYVANPNPGVVNFRQIAKSSATTTDGASVQAPSNPRNYQQAFEKDPNGSIAWTGTAVDAATFGIKVV